MTNADLKPENVIVELAVGQDLVEATIGLLWVNGTTGIEERTLPQPSGQPADQPDAVMLRAGFDSPQDADAALAVLGSDVELLNRVVPDGSELDRANEFAKPVLIGDRLLVQPARGISDTSMVAAVTDGTNQPKVIIIDAGRSFGHGGHPTTRLALEAIAEITATPERDIATMLDVGCGSGVLAIAGLSLGIERAVGIDTAADAVTATNANARANNVESRLEVVHGQLADYEGQFPLVVANLEAPVLESLAPELMSRVEPGGFLVLGGILKTRWVTLAEHFVPGHQLRAPVLDDWIGPVVQPTEALSADRSTFS